MDKKDWWSYKDKKLFADTAGINQTLLSNILHRKIGVSTKRAKVYESICLDVLGKTIPWTAWACNRDTKHPGFYGEPNDI